MFKLTLKPSMKLDYPPIDDEHKRLIDIVNTIITSPGDESCEASYERMRNFSRIFFDHMDRESKILEGLGFPETRDHKIQHEKIRQDIKSFVEKCRDNKYGGLSKDEAVRNVIWYFLEDAIEEDLKIKSFLYEIGVTKCPER